jgi:uncharacterized membrane protein YhaH (DUF805 family)
MENYPQSFNPVSAFVYALKHYADFNGRARRQEFWMFYLANLIISTILGILIFITGAAAITAAISADGSIDLPALASSMGIMGTLGNIVGLALTIPSLAVTARRMHDIGKSGWWMLISLVPCAGPIIFLVLLCKDSEPENQYGPNPKN